MAGLAPEQTRKLNGLAPHRREPLRAGRHRLDASNPRAA